MSTKAFEQASVGALEQRPRPTMLAGGRRLAYPQEASPAGATDAVRSHAPTVQRSNAPTFLVPAEDAPLSKTLPARVILPGVGELELMPDADEPTAPFTRISTHQ